MKKIPFIISAIILAVLLLGFQGCKSGPPDEVAIPQKGASKMDIKKEIFGTLADGREVEIYTLINTRGIEARLMTYGATLVSLKVPDREGLLEDITLGFDTLEGYPEVSPYFGAIVGRYGNRIAKGKFSLDGMEYTLAVNNGDNHLHGGNIGFDKKVWTAETFTENNSVGIIFSGLSPDGEEGYPGNLQYSVTYTLTDDNELKLEYEVVTDKATPLNLTHHTYWNLLGAGKGDVLGHELLLKADSYTPVDRGLIPTGEIRAVAGSAMDFTIPHPIGERIADVEGGYDHNFVLTSGGGELTMAAQVYEPTSGRMLVIFTTEPGIQFYSGNFLDGSISGKRGNPVNKHFGFCLETQHFPDSPNQSDFPSTILRPGEKYHSLTVHKFSVKTEKNQL
ncbi:aldose epimerase family protein [Acidobacteriota bacterium]